MPPNIAIEQTVIALILACAFSATAQAECVRWKPDPKSARPPDFDGPGSFGPLHGTVTLDCLKYVGSIQQGGVEHVMVRDERGTVYRLKVGDYVGENGGIISRIDNEAIYIKQLVRRNADWEEITVRFPRR